MPDEIIEFHVPWLNSLDLVRFGELGYEGDKVVAPSYQECEISMLLIADIVLAATRGREKLTASSSWTRMVLSQR
jgi:hypothetical protein